MLPILLERDNPRLVLSFMLKHALKVLHTVRDILQLALHINNNILIVHIFKIVHT